LLALGSPTHPVTTDAWAAYTSTYKWQTHYGISLLTFPPLFGHQYSHLWFDFRNIADAFMRERGIDYFENSVRATLANREYSIRNPLGYPNYGPLEWGLTASDVPTGYAARGAPPPFNDDGTLAPTAPGGSFAFTPDASLATLGTMYDRYRERLWGPYGFRDAYNVYQSWFAPDHLGIDQGPFVIMIENHRTGSVWNHFMRNEAALRGLVRAGFSDVDVRADRLPVPPSVAVTEVFPNPADDVLSVEMSLNRTSSVSLAVYDMLGRRLIRESDVWRAAGRRILRIGIAGLPSGVYILRIQTDHTEISTPFIKL
ncbi:MAG: glucoamylase family protein, partial [Bacteroidota bacterium]